MKKNGTNQTKLIPGLMVVLAMLSALGVGIALTSGSARASTARMEMLDAPTEGTAPTAAAPSTDSTSTSGGGNGSTDSHRQIQSMREIVRLR